MNILMWAYLAERPLHVNEVFDALAVKLGDKNLDTDNFPSQQSWLDCCLGLVIVDEETSTVRLVHFSLQEYLRSQCEDLFKDGHDRIAKTCLTYLCFENITASPVMSTKELLGKFPFLDYAACQWGHHIRKELNLSKQSLDLATSYLLQKQLKLRCGIAFLFQLLGPEYWLKSIRERFLETFSSLHIAAYFGTHLEVVKLLIDTGQVDVDSKDELDSRTPLSWAAENGHLEIVKLLIDTGRVDLNSRDITHDRTPLSRAAGNGHLEVVKFLINTYRVDIDSKDRFNETPLSWAVRNGHLEVVKLLIDTGRVDVDSKDRFHRTPLSWAAGNGHLGVANLLINTGRVDVDSKDELCHSSLSRATENGHLEVAKLLVDTARVDVDLKDGLHRITPSWAAGKRAAEKRATNHIHTPEEACLVIAGLNKF
ncbi:Ankyrin-3 [Dactylellina cionopaga]|nr:Ankyrin-3 [Dactylellina cionopaga]